MAKILSEMWKSSCEILSKAGSRQKKKIEKKWKQTCMPAEILFDFDLMKEPNFPSIVQEVKYRWVELWFEIDFTYSEYKHHAMALLPIISLSLFSVYCSAIVLLLMYRDEQVDQKITSQNKWNK